MGLKIQYTSVAGGAALLSCEGSGSSVFLPEQVGGFVLREIGAYAFSAPGAAAEHLPAGAEIYSAEVGTSSGEGREFLGGASLREVILPHGIRSIGEYAFYNCTGLARLSFAEGATTVGNGAFMNCGALRNLVFSASADAPTCLPGILSEVSHEVRVTFLCGDQSSVWIFPDYFEESVENSPAHIFEHFFHGAGYRYRQCFQGDRLDAESYDKQFPMARVEAEPETALRIALERLRRPFRLSEESRGRYLAHLKEFAVEAAELLIRDDDPEGLAFLAANDVLNRQSIGAALEAAARAGRADCLSVLLNEQHSRFAPKEKTFEL